MPNSGWYLVAISLLEDQRGTGIHHTEREDVANRLVKLLSSDVISIGRILAQRQPTGDNWVVWDKQIRYWRQQDWPHGNKIGDIEPNGFRTLSMNALEFERSILEDESKAAAFIEKTKQVPPHVFTGNQLAMLKVLVADFLSVFKPGAAFKQDRDGKHFRDTDVSWNTAAMGDRFRAMQDFANRAYLGDKYGQPLDAADFAAPAEWVKVSKWALTYQKLTPDRIKTEGIGGAAVDAAKRAEENLREFAGVRPWSEAEKRFPLWIRGNRLPRHVAEPVEQLFLKDELPAPLANLWAAAQLARAAEFGILTVREEHSRNPDALAPEVFVQNVGCMLRSVRDVVLKETAPANVAVFSQRFDRLIDSTKATLDALCAEPLSNIKLGRKFQQGPWKDAMKRSAEAGEDVWRLAEFVGGGSGEAKPPVPTIDSGLLQRLEAVEAVIPAVLEGNRAGFERVAGVIESLGARHDDDTPAVKLPKLKPWAWDAWKANQVGMTATAIAATLAKKHNDPKITQPRVSEQIQRAKLHAEASGLAGDAAKALPQVGSRAPARTLDPAAADAGQRTDGRAKHLREKARQIANEE